MSPYHQIKAVLIALLLLIFVLLPSCVIALPFGLRRRLKIICPVWVFCSKILLRYACQAKIEISQDHRSDHLKGTPPFGLYVANHQSLIDIPLIVTMYQAPPIMKKEVLYIPIFGILGKVSGALPVSRSKLGSRKKVFEQAKKRILLEKIGLQVYPEGTRSKDANPKAYEEIKKTLLFFAHQEGIPVVATSLYGTKGVLNSKGFIQPGRHLGIIVHKELLPQDFNLPEEFAQAVWAKVIEGHRELKNRLAPLNEN